MLVLFNWGWSENHLKSTWKIYQAKIVKQNLLKTRFWLWTDFKNGATTKDGSSLLGSTICDSGNGGGSNGGNGGGGNTGNGGGSNGNGNGSGGGNGGSGGDFGAICQVKSLYHYENYSLITTSSNKRHWI